MKLRDLPDGAMCVVLTGQFQGEVFFKNVAGVHSLTCNRYWPSEYINRNSKDSAQMHYEGPMDEDVQMIHQASGALKSIGGKA